MPRPFFGRGIVIGSVAIVALLSGCGTKEARRADEDAQRATAFCVTNPTRDFAEIFRFVAASGATGENSKGLVDFTAGGYADPPTAIKPEVELVLARYKATSGQATTLDEAGVAAAVSKINTWMRDNCPTAPATTG